MNKFFFSLLFAISILFNVQSQGLVEFSMGSGYAYDIFYSLNNGITGYADRTNWELAFSTNPSNNNIRINSGSGVTLFKVSENLDDWGQIESITSNAAQLRNSYTDWSMGAFVSDAIGDLNYGWGNYNLDTYTTEGNSIYIINYGSESKKMIINSAFNGLFNITIANLDGSNEANFSVNTANYINKKFIYYSLINMQTIDREPDSDNWDLVFTKYEADLNKSNNDSELFYIVTGALSNNNMVFEYDGFLDVNPDLDVISEGFSSAINTIGWDWKQYSGGGYSIVANRSYFIFNTAFNSLYKLVFESFSGGSSGNCSFLIENLEYEPIHILESNDLNVDIYPNPNPGFFKISSSLNEAFMMIKDLNGRLVLTKDYQQDMSLDLTDLKDGIYFVILESNNIYINKKIIIQR